MRPYLGLVLVVAWVTVINTQHLRWREGRNLSFSNIISNYLTKYPANVSKHRRYHKHTSPVSAASNRVLQLSGPTPLPPKTPTFNRATIPTTRHFLSKQNSIRNNQKLVEHKFLQENTLSKSLPVRIKLPDFVNKQQTPLNSKKPVKQEKKQMGIFMSQNHLKRMHQPFKTEHTLQQNQPEKFQNKLNSFKSADGKTSMLFSNMKSSLKNEKEVHFNNKQRTILQQKEKNKKFQMNQNSAYNYDNETRIMNLVQGNISPGNSITQHKNVVFMDNHAKMKNAIPNNEFNNFYQSKFPSYQKENFPTTKLTEGTTVKPVTKPLFGDIGVFQQEISTLRSLPLFDEFSLSKQFQPPATKKKNTFQNLLSTSDTRHQSHNQIGKSEKFQKNENVKRIKFETTTSRTANSRNYVDRDHPYPFYSPLNERPGKDSWFDDEEFIQPSAFSFGKMDIFKEKPDSASGEEAHHQKLVKTLQSTNYRNQIYPFQSDEFIKKNQNQFLFSDSKTKSATSSKETRAQTKYLSPQTLPTNIKSYKTTNETSKLNKRLAILTLSSPSQPNFFLNNDKEIAKPQTIRKTSVPVAKSGWKILDEIKEDNDDYYNDDYSNYDYNYNYDYEYKNIDRSMDTAAESQFRQLHFNILSSPADIPKIGVQTDFKPIEVIYNEMFQEPRQKSQFKQARSFNFINSAPTKSPYPYDLQQQSNTQHLHFLPTPAPKSPSTSLRSVPSQRNSKINKRFLNIDENYQLRQNHKPVQDDFKENDFVFRKIYRKKKSTSLPFNKYHTSENILHAIVQNEIYSQDFH